MGHHEMVNDYKTKRLQEMAAAWKGTVLEPHTVMLLSMLIQEDGTLTAERRHDCQSNGNCWSIGIQGHHVGWRGTPLIYGKPHKSYWNWEDRDGDGKHETSPQKAFELDYPKFTTDWREQFREYTFRMTDCIDSGKAANQCIQDWNSNEQGRIGKVKQHNSFVLDSLSAAL
jgi:hypothetical protein